MLDETKGISDGQVRTRTRVACVDHKRLFGKGPRFQTTAAVPMVQIVAAWEGNVAKAWAIFMPHVVC